MNEQQRWANILSIGAMLMLEIFWAFVCLYTGAVRRLLPASVSVDVFYYVTSIFLAFFSFLLLHLLLRSRLRIPAGESKQREFLLELVVLALFALVGAVIFLYEKNIYYAGDEYMPWHGSARIEWLLLLGAALLLCQLFTRLKAVHWRREEKGGLWFLYGALAAVAGYAVYAPNTFQAFYNLYHANAYFNSVYRVLHLKPYHAINSGMYGFYGILVAPLVKLCGGTFQSFVAVMAVLTAACMLCYFYVLEHLTAKRSMRILGSIGIIAVTTAWGTNIHLQTYPSRLLFAGFTLAWIVGKEQLKENRKNAIVKRAGSQILLTLSLIWSLETGLGCVLAFVGSEIVKLLQRHSLGDRLFWKQAMWKVLWLLASFLGAYASVGLYNLAVSGSFISLSDFLFPFVGNPYVQALNLPMELFPSFWMLISVLIFLVIATVLLNTKLCGGKKEELSAVYLTACTILCAVQMVYYVNRSVRMNLFMLLPVLLLMVAGLTEYVGKQDIWNHDALGNGILRGTVACGVLVLVLTALLTCSNGLALEARREENRNLEPVYDWLSTLQEEVPRDTVGIGIGVPELYSYLGWDTGYYGIDIPDFLFAKEEAKNHVYELLNATDEIFIAEYALEFVTECADGKLEPFYATHELKNTYYFGAGTFLLYERTGNEGE